MELETIGKGGSGKIIKCFDEKSWRFYALKIIEVEADKPWKITLIAKEIEAMIKLTKFSPDKFA
jgi:hypothetical protein